MAVLSGSVTISDLQDGVAGASVVFTNETHTFISSPEGMIDEAELQGFGTFIAVYAGAQQYSYIAGNTPSGTNFTVGTISVVPTGNDLTVNSTAAASGATVNHPNNSGISFTNPTGAASILITLDDAGNTSTGFVDADTSIDSVTLSIPISLVISGSTLTYNRVVTLTKAKGGNARVVRLAVNQQAIEYPRDLNAVPKNASDFSAGGEVNIDFTATSYNFSAGDAAGVWAYQINGIGAFTNLASSGGTINAVTNTTAPIWSSTTTYSDGDLVQYELNDKVAVFESLTNSNTNNPPISSGSLDATNWVRRTNIYGIITGTNNNTLTIGPLMFNDLLGSNQRIVYRHRRTVGTSTFDDQITIIKIQDALGAYSVRIESSAATVFKNNSGTTTLTARLYLSELVIGASEINSYEWSKDGVVLTTTAETAYSNTTTYNAGDSVSLVSGTGNDAFTYNFESVSGSTGQSPPTSSDGSSPGSNSQWTLVSVVLKTSQSSGNGPTNASIDVDATDIVANNSDLFACEIDYDER